MFPIERFLTHSVLQTGDFLATAVGIAQQVGIITNGRVDTLDDARGSASKQSSSVAIATDPGAESLSLAVEGAELETMSQADWDIIIDRYKEIVFARTTPEQKLRYSRGNQGPSGQHCRRYW